MENPKSINSSIQFDDKMYSLDCSNTSSSFISVGTVIPNENNSISLFSKTDSSLKLHSIHNTKFPPTSIKFSPILDDYALIYSDYQITHLKFDPENQDSIVFSQTYQNEHEDNELVPITAIDWGNFHTNRVAQSSTDCTCLVWDIEKKSVLTHIIAHDKQVFDIKMLNGDNEFVSTGADGSIRCFDVRLSENIVVLFENVDLTPLHRVVYNGGDKIASWSIENNIIYLIDLRNYSEPLCSLSSHEGTINAGDFSCKNKNLMCTVSDDKRAYLWDIFKLDYFHDLPDFCLESNLPYVNCKWMKSNEIARLADNSLDIVSFDESNSDMLF